MKYMIIFLNVLIYVSVISIITGIIGVLMGQSFTDNVFPTGEGAFIRWIIRAAVVIYFTISRPLYGSR